MHRELDGAPASSGLTGQRAHRRTGQKWELMRFRPIDRLAGWPVGRFSVMAPPRRSLAPPSDAVVEGDDENGRHRFISPSLTRSPHENDSDSPTRCLRDRRRTPDRPVIHSVRLRRAQDARKTCNRSFRSRGRRSFGDGRARCADTGRQIPGWLSEQNPVRAASGRRGRLTLRSGQLANWPTGRLARADLFSAF